MTKRQVHIFSLGVLLLLFALSFFIFPPINSTAQQIAPKDIFANDPALKNLPKYRDWTRVNDTPKRSNNFQIELGG